MATYGVLGGNKMRRKQITTAIFIGLVMSVSLFGAVWWFDKYNVQPRIIDLYGDTFYDMGLMYGSRIKHILGGIGALVTLAEQAFNALPIVNVTEYIEGYKQFLPDYAKEMLQGISNATGVDYDSLITLNGFADFAEILVTNFMGCSQFAVINNTIDGLGPLYGRTLDYMLLYIFENWQVVLRIAPPPSSGFHSVMGVTIAGWVGFLSGMSDAGMSMGVSQIRSEDVGIGTPVPLIILSTLMNTSNTIEAVQFITNSSPSYLKHAAAWCYMLLDKSEVAAVVEVSYSLNSTRWHVDEGTDFIVATNHFVTPAMISHQAPTSADSSTVYRKRVLEEVLLNKTDFDLQDAVDTLRSHYDISIHGDPGYPYKNCINNHGALSGTMHGFIAVVLHNYMLVCLVSPSRGPFYLITFSEVIGPVA
jgi:predicted choloylglycine hydrolase